MGIPGVSVHSRWPLTGALVTVKTKILIGAVEVGGAEKICGQSHSAAFSQRHAFADHIGEHHVDAAHGDVEVTIN